MKYYIFDLMIKELSLELEKEYNIEYLLLLANNTNPQTMIKSSALVCLEKIIREALKLSLDKLIFSKKSINIKTIDNSFFYPFFGNVNNPLLLVDKYELNDIEIKFFNMVRWQEMFFLKSYDDFEKYLREE